MSFDLGVWYSEKALTSKQAGEIYVKLCEGTLQLEGERQQVAAFYDELTKKWPEIDTVPDEKIDDHDYCPWSCAIDHSGMHVITSCVWSKGQDVGEFVEQLAARHGLLLYDPQEDAVKLPPGLKT
jgi:hypothetical protein